LFTVYIGLINTNNQIIQAIAVDIACAGVRMRVITMASQPPPQAMSTAMAWMI
jgi:hypothetical protein